MFLELYFKYTAMLVIKFSTAVIIGFKPCNHRKIEIIAFLLSSPSRGSSYLFRLCYVVILDEMYQPIHVLKGFLLVIH